MAEIKDCIGKHVKISKGSITIKAENGKTCGVVRNTTSLYDLQANKQMDYYKKIKTSWIARKNQHYRLYYFRWNYVCVSQY